MDEVFRYIDEHGAAALDEIVEYCRLPTVSAQKRSIDETAAYTVSLLEREGFSVRVLEKEAPGFPVVLGEQPGASERTLLLYNHYDVQPPDPLHEWTTPAFEPVLRDGKLFGRGVSDNKGNIVSRLLAIRALKERLGGLPCNLKFVIEGDEEIGSPMIGPFVRKHASLLKADACVWEGGYAYWDGSPTLMLGVKGLLYLELEAQGPNRDVHSSYATVVPNPAWRLAWALAALKDLDERILIPGFYDDVRSPNEEELATLQVMPDEATETLSHLGLENAVLKVQGVEYRRRHMFEPTCTIDGLTSGYQGPGAKTILPAKASAKLDFRLVPDQDPDDIVRKTRTYFDSLGFEDVKIRQFSTERAWRTAVDDPFVTVCQDAAREAYGRDAVLVPTFPATGPMYHFAHDLGIPSVLAGVNYVGGRDHAPDEHIRLEDFYGGTKHLAALIARFAAASP